MKPSTLTPTGAPHTRGFLVQTDDGRRGRTFHRETYINDKVAVYLETSTGEYSDKGSLFTRDRVQITGYID